MKIDHETYLKEVLKSKKNELEHLNTEHRIAIAVYEAKKDMLYKQIHSLENQLEED